MGYQDIFKRYELKYLVTQEQKALLLRAMEPYMRPDEYGRSTICNIYFDTPDYLLVKRSLEKPVYKEKLRVRSYGRATRDSLVFLELKKKYKGVVYKRRICAQEQEAMDYLIHGNALFQGGQIAEEIDYFKELYQGLAPAVYLSYEREAFYGKEDKELRVTFDENILWRNQALSLCAKSYGMSVLEPKTTLMEIKIASAVPLWLCRLLSENAIFQTGFSKYGRAYEQMLTLDENEIRTGGRKYA
ncbi:MAG: polyphosphate polymerase domain-containing protein [Acetatifactor sp.]|nr:polyphosphate polymerase domain-containing protein [Acetatifactor sp.]